MVGGKGRGICLASQNIRDEIVAGNILTPVKNLSRENGKFVDQTLEDRISSSSFEPMIGDEVFIIDAEQEGLFTVREGEQVYRTLLQLPARRRQRIDIKNGFELKTGFSHLIPLEERVILRDGASADSSPKSTFGRLFLHTRLLSDYNPTFDRMSHEYKTNTELRLWLLVQPQRFNVVVYPGQALTQLRFFDGPGSQLTMHEMIDEFKKRPLLYERKKGVLVPARHRMADGLQIHGDISGEYTEGVVGLRARKNPTPIDTRRGDYLWQDFFDPIVVKRGFGRMTAKPRGEYYLLVTREALRVPDDMNVKVVSHSRIGFIGPKDFAPLASNGWGGNLVLEVRSDELENMELVDGMPASELHAFRTPKTDKPYKGSYQDQLGPIPPKFMTPIDYGHAAQIYAKLSRDVLTQDAKILRSHRGATEGFEPITRERVAALRTDILSGLFHSRYDCESDELVLQPIPYVLVFGPDGTVFSYQRTKNIEEYGEARLFGERSIGVGGHIARTDEPNYIEQCIERELKQEVRIAGKPTRPRFIGTVFKTDKPVDRVHFGLVYAIHTGGNVKPNEASIPSGRMVSIRGLVENPSKYSQFETWSRVLIPHLPMIYGYGR